MDRPPPEGLPVVEGHPPALPCPRLALECGIWDGLEALFDFPFGMEVYGYRQTVVRIGLGVVGVK